MWTRAASQSTNAPSSQICSPLTRFDAVTGCLRRRSPAQQPRDEPLLLFASHVDQAELPERLDALGLDLHGAGQHLHRDVGPADRLAYATHEEVGLLVVACQLHGVFDVADRLLRPPRVLGLAAVERPAEVGVVLALVRMQLGGLPEAAQREVVGPLAERRLALLEAELGFD